MSNKGTIASIRIADRLLALARAGKMGLYTDIDGTISRIAPTPASAAVEPQAIAALEHIQSLGVRVVAVSGRAATDAHALIGLDSIDYAGNHGFELLTSAGRKVPAEVERAAANVSRAIVDLRAALPQLPEGVLVEDKTYTGSVHFRLAKDPALAEAILAPILAEIAGRYGLVITAGRLVYEIRPNLHINKGVFTSADIRVHGLETAAFLGDDITDLDGFDAITRLVATKELLDGACVGVRAPESPRAIIDRSDLLADSVEHLSGELAHFAHLLKERAA